MLRVTILFAVGLMAIVLGYALSQRKLLYYPSHHQESYGLAAWRHDGQLIGYAREVASPANVWLLLHGNGGQASDRVYALAAFSGRDAVYILEYPGYGQRPGSPSMAAFNTAAIQAYELLRVKYPQTPVCVAGESIGSGPAALLAKRPQPPAKMVLIVPFDTLDRVAARHYPFLPIRLLLLDNWDNIAALEGYQGVVEIYAAHDDAVIPVDHARALAAAKSGARFNVIDGGHNDWAEAGRVTIRNP